MPRAAFLATAAATIAFLPVLSMATPQAATQNDAVLALEKLGAKIERDEKQPARPVIGVDL